MARITVEDCLENVDNRFELVLLASKRARDLATKGAKAKVPEDNDKVTVIALREIAEGLITKENVEVEEEQNIVEETQTYVEEEQIIEFSPRPLRNKEKK